jgi:hypothetical protein
MNGKTPRGDARRADRLRQQRLGTEAQVAGDGTGLLAPVVAKTPDQILRDINEALTAVETGTSETQHRRHAGPADHALQLYRDDTARHRQRHDDPVVPPGQQRRRRGLTILKSRALETAGTGSTTRMVAYENSPRW